MDAGNAYACGLTDAELRMNGSARNHRGLIGGDKAMSQLHAPVRQGDTERLLQAGVRQNRIGWTGGG